MQDLLSHQKACQSQRQPRERASRRKGAGQLAASRAPQVCRAREGCRGTVVAHAGEVDLEPEREEVLHCVTAPLSAGL